jgi:hypothetical protein
MYKVVLKLLSDIVFVINYDNKRELQIETIEKNNNKFQ